MIAFPAHLFADSVVVTLNNGDRISNIVPPFDRGLLVISAGQGELRSSGVRSDHQQRTARFRSYYPPVSVTIDMPLPVIFVSRRATLEHRRAPLASVAPVRHGAVSGSGRQTLKPGSQNRRRWSCREHRRSIRTDDLGAVWRLELLQEKMPKSRLD